MIEDIRYYNRKTKSQETEIVYGENWLKLIYGSPLGALPLWVAIKRAWFSKWYGKRMDSVKSRSKVIPFIKKYNLDESEFLKEASDFHSFNDFFCRKLNHDARPIEADEKKIVFPADGRHTAIKDLSATQRIFAKGQTFNLSELFKDEKLAKTFHGGSAIISRLCPVDYHRFHFPVSGDSTKPKLINGALFSVNPIALRKDISIFWENKRYLTILENSPVGKVAIFLIGATCVGTVKFSAKLPKSVTKGEELGYFLFGGSCVLTIFEKNKVKLADDLLDCSEKGIELFAQMGEFMCQEN